MEISAALCNQLEEREREIGELFKHIEALVAKHKHNDQAFSHTGAAFALLALLVSERYAECLRKLYGEGDKLSQLLFMHYRDEELIREAIDQMITVRNAKELYQNTLSDPPPIVELERIDAKIDEGYWKNRIALSVDPRQPLEVLVDSFARIMRRKQEAMKRAIRRECELDDLPDFRAGWRRVGTQSVAGEEEKYLEECVNLERLRFDMPRSVQGKKIRNPHTLFNEWWLCLRVYHARKNHGATWQGVVSAPWYFRSPPPDQGKTYVSKDVRKANALIDAAWKGIPLANVKLPN